MTFISESLSNGEHIYKEFQHHWAVKFFITLNFILGFITLGIWLIPAVIYWLKWKCTEQGVTSKRIIRKHGIIARTTDELRLSAIESVYFSQGILGRIFGFGTVTITGRGQGAVVLSWMVDPMNVKLDIENAQEASDKE